MSWNDDSWRDGYDAWKLRSPDDEYQERCYHEGFEIDWMGLARCGCGDVWTPNQADIDDFRYRNKIYDRHCRRQEFRERWFGWWDRLCANYRTWRWRRRHGFKKLVDDDIPF